MRYEPSYGRERVHALSQSEHAAMGGQKRASATTALSVASKHEELEEAAASIGVRTRAIQKTTGGVEQHVVCLQTGGIIRWPTAYQHKESTCPVVWPSAMDEEADEM